MTVLNETQLQISRRQLKQMKFLEKQEMAQVAAICYGVFRSGTGRRALRDMHFNLQNGICAYCGEHMNKNREPHKKDELSYTLEHIVPRRLGGEDTLQNTICVCAGCNHARDSMPLKLHHIVGIFITKGDQAFVPIFRNLYHAYVPIINVKFRNVFAGIYQFVGV